MRTDAFRSRLKANKMNVENAIACCRRVEKALGNLDMAFDADGLDSMIEPHRDALYGQVFVLLLRLRRRGIAGTKVTCSRTVTFLVALSLKLRYDTVRYHAEGG